MSSIDVLTSELSVNRNLFIEASAGTGKTFAIEHLFIRRLLEPTQGRFLSVSEIACLTFTRACAKELKTRIYGAIDTMSALLQEEKELPSYMDSFIAIHSKDTCLQRLKMARRGIESALITTIHGFAARLLFEYSSSGTADEINFAESHEIERIIYETISYEKDEMIELLLQSLFSRKMPIHSIVKEISKVLWQNAEGEEFIDVVDELLSTCQQSVLPEEKVLEELMQASSLYCGLSDIKNRLKPDVENFFYAFSGLFGNKPTKAKIAAIIRAPETLSDLFLKLKKDKEAPAFISYCIEQFDVLLQKVCSKEKCLTYITKALLPKVRKRCKKLKLFTPESLLLDVVDALQEPAFKKFVREKISALFIDEFQDTDPLQWGIFSSLQDENFYLYLVGDPKQSMYRFRGADIYTYMSVKRSFDAGGHLSLTSNFRSTPRLTEGVNKLFVGTEASSLFFLPKDQQFLSFPALHAAGKAHELLDNKKAIHIPYVKASQGKKRSWPHEEAEREMLKFFAQEIVQTKLPLSSYAVLVKDRNQSMRVSAFFDECKIPVQVLQKELIGSKPAIHMLLRLLRAISHPEKRSRGIEFFAFEPYCLNASELALLNQDVTSYMEKARPLFRLREEITYRGVLAALHQFFSEIGSVCERELYRDTMQLLDLLGERDQKKGTLSIDEAISCLVEIANSNESISGKLYTQNEGGKEAVSLITMHKSKGLEFDVVFALGTATRNLDSSIDPEQEAETIRILYVAATRAKRRLYLPLFIDEEKSLPERSLAPFELLLQKKEKKVELIAEEIGASFGQVYDIPAVTYEAIESCRGTEALKRCAPPQLMRLELISFSSSREERAKLPIEAVEPDFPKGALVGSLFHALIQKLWKSRKDVQKDEVKECIRGTVLEAHLEAVLSKMIALFTYPIKEFGNIALKDIEDSAAWFEKSFFYYKNEQQGVIGAIDLIVRISDRYYLIDFKSHMLPSYNVEALTQFVQNEGYLEQGRLYSEAVRRSGKQLGGFLFLFIHGPNVVFIPEEVT